MLKAYKLEKSIDTLWDESPRRVMFVLKDKNTPDGDDTRLWLVDGKKGKVNRELNSSEVTKTGFSPIFRFFTPEPPTTHCCGCLWL